MASRIRITRVFSVLALIILLAPMISQRALAGDQVDWDRWAAHNPAETHEPDHKYLTKYLAGFGQVSKGRSEFAYAAMKGQGVKYLEAYIKYLEGIPVSLLNRDEQLTLWLNLYNAGAIHAVASQRRVPKNMKTNRGIPGTPGDMWKKDRFVVEGQALSLEDIEMNILARHWQGGMWVYGLTWCAKDSPPLPLMAFYSSTLDTQLEEIAKSFVGRSSNVRVRDGVVELSSFYNWHRAQFGGTDAAIIEHVRSLAGEKLAGALADTTTISGYGFSWRTNSFEPSAPMSGLGGGGGGGGPGY